MSMGNGDSERDDIFSKAIRAGKRTYFFDVKSTKGNDLYLTITESKKRFHDDGKHSYIKHKLFLYKEDFEKFADGFQETLEKIKSLQEADNEFQAAPSEQTEKIASEQYTDISFEDLNKD
jgi:hypothetical protein